MTLNIGQRLWVTIVNAIDPIDGQLKAYGGPNVPGITLQDAVDYCQNNGLGYCNPVGILMSEIPTKEDGLTPDWDNQIDFETDIDNLN